jgi:hypothetical protein
MTATDTDWWYAGLKAVGERPFSDEDSAEADEIASETTRKIALILAATILAPLAVIASVFVPGLTFVLTPGFVLTVSLMWQWRSLSAAFRYWRAVRADIRGRVVVRCEGSLDDLLVSRARLLDEPPSVVRISSNRDERVAIEVLPVSQRLWSCDGRHAHHTVIVPKSSTASAPEHARMAANFVQPVNDDVAMHQRALTPAELMELKGYAPAVDPARYLLAGLLVDGAVAGFWLVLQRRTDSLLIAAVFSIAAFLAVIRLVRDASRRRRISRDVTAGLVIIVRARQGDGLGKPKEFLPHSGIAWTTDGLPAAWRRLFR